MYRGIFFSSKKSQFKIQNKNKCLISVIMRVRTRQVNT